MGFPGVTQATVMGGCCMTEKACEGFPPAKRATNYSCGGCCMTKKYVKLFIFIYFFSFFRGGGGAKRDARYSCGRA